jgi:hypothetical protein
MEMLAIFGVCAVTALVAGLFGWQQGRRPYFQSTQIEPPGPEGVPVRPADLTGMENRCY